MTLRKSKKGPVKRPDHIASYFRREWKTLLIVAVSGTLFNMGQSLCAIRQGELVDAIADIEKGYGGSVSGAVLAFLSTVFCIQLLRLSKRYFVRRFANAADISMRMMVYNHMVHESTGDLENENSGDVMTRALGDVDRTVEGMRKVTTEVFDTGVLLATYFVTMLTFSAPCTVLSCLPVPAALAAARFLKTYVEKYNRLAREQNALVAAKSLEAVRQSTICRVTGSAERTADQYEAELEKLERVETGAGILENSMQPLYNAIAVCGALGVILYGGKIVLARQWSVGDFTAYLTIYTAFTLKIAKVSKLFNTWQKAKVSWKRVKPYLTAWTEEDPAEDGESHARVFGAVAAGGNLASEPSCRQTPITLMLRDVTESPDKRGGLTSPVSFAGKRGQIIGIAGPVASGKSMLAKAMAGLVPYRGTIRVLGHDLAILSGAEKAKLISFMGHDPQLFDLSLKDNILLGREEKPGRIRQVLSDVCFEEDLKSLPEGENTLIGSGGKALSGGQRARISMARALYAENPVIILDDPFANVDRSTEMRMLDNLCRNYKDNLLVITSHRMSVFERADLVLMIEDGGFVRMGSHESLMKESVRYRQTFQAQMDLQETSGKIGAQGEES